MREKIIICLIVICSVCFSPLAVLADEMSDDFDYVRAKVLTLSENGVERTIIAEIKSGEFEGKKVTMVDNVSDSYPVRLKEGVNVVVAVEKFSDAEASFYFQDIYRLPYLILILIVFIAALLIVGRSRGLRALVSLGVGIAAVFGIYVPKVLMGWSPVWLGLGLAVLLLAISLILITGFSRKSAVAFLGALGGLVFAVLLSFLFAKLARLTGFSSEDAFILSSLRGALSIEGVLFGGIIIGTLGAVMDVAVSVASGVNEVIEHSKKQLSSPELFQAGMSVGRDIMGTMANTLIFAYVGASLPVLLLFSATSDKILKIMNFEFIAEELIRALAGTTALFIIVPLTAFIGARLLDNTHESKN